MTPERARWAREDKRVVAELADGAVIVELPFAGHRYLAREILKEAGDAVVLEPEDARQAVLEAAEVLAGAVKRLSAVAPRRRRRLVRLLGTAVRAPRAGTPGRRPAAAAVDDDVARGPHVALLVLAAELPGLLGPVDVGVGLRNSTLPLLQSSGVGAPSTWS